MQRLYDLPEHALIDMGDFVGGTLKYLRRHPVARLTLAGGFAKLAKLAAGHLDLHSSRSRVDGAGLARLLAAPAPTGQPSPPPASSDSAAEILDLAGERAWRSPRRSRARRARWRWRRSARRHRGRGRDRRSRRRVSRAGRRAHDPGRPMTGRHLLILGGTGEAAALARGALARFGDAMTVTTALAGRTRHPGPIAGQVRIGGFGGAAGLADYLIEQRDRPPDRRDPSVRRRRSRGRRGSPPSGPACRGSCCCARRGAATRSTDGSRSTASRPRRMLVGRVGRCAWLTVGAGALAAFAPATGIRFVVRLIDPPRETAAAAVPRGRARARPVQPLPRSGTCCSATRSTCWSARRAAGPPPKQS